MTSASWARFASINKTEAPVVLWGLVVGKKAAVTQHHTGSVNGPLRPCPPSRPGHRWTASGCRPPAQAHFSTFHEQEPHA